MVKRWYADFKHDCTDRNDAECSGCSHSAVVLENNRKSINSFWPIVNRILHEHLPMGILYSKWLPCLLTVDQKQQRIDDSEHCLQQFQRNKKEFLCKYVTMGETWIHHFTPVSNQQSAEWIAAGKSPPKWPKMQTSAGKVLASVFWGA